MTAHGIPRDYPHGARRPRPRIYNPTARMDFEQLVTMIQAPHKASAKALDLLGVHQADAGDELEDIALDLAEALHAALNFQPYPDDDDNQLAGALEKWLP